MRSLHPVRPRLERARTRQVDDGAIVLRQRRGIGLSLANATLPSALQRFTSEFGMGSGGSTALLPPGKILIQKADVNNDFSFCHYH